MYSELSSELFFSSCLLFCLGACFEVKRRECLALKKKLSVFNSVYLRHYGFHEWFGLFDIESFDGGKLWYALKTLSDGQRIVLGPAEQIHPGILSELCIFPNSSACRDNTTIFPTLTQTKSLPSITNSAVQQRTSSGTIAQLRIPEKKYRHSQSICMRLPKLEA